MLASEATVHLTIGSYFENIELVQIVIEEALNRLTIDEDSSHWLGIAVREAVANAIKHGNQGDPAKRVEVAVGFTESELVISVRDEGEGFDPGKVSDPLEPENLLRASGRGIFFMRKFVDEIDFSFHDQGGTVVTLRKQLDSPPPLV